MTTTRPTPIIAVNQPRTHIVSHRGAVLTVAQGTLWLTQTDDPNDYVLRTGAALTLRAGRVVLEAEHGDSAHYTLVTPPYPVLVQAQALLVGLCGWVTRVCGRNGVKTHAASQA